MAKLTKPTFRIEPVVLTSGPTYKVTVAAVRVENRNVGEPGGLISVSLLNSANEVVATRCLSTDGLLTKESLLKALKYESPRAKVIDADVTEDAPGLSEGAAPEADGPATTGEVAPETPATDAPAADATEAKKPAPPKKPSTSSKPSAAKKK